MFLILDVIDTFGPVRCFKKNCKITREKVQKKKIRKILTELILENIKKSKLTYVV